MTIHLELDHAVNKIEPWIAPKRAKKAAGGTVRRRRSMPICTDSKVRSQCQLRGAGQGKMSSGVQEQEIVQPESPEFWMRRLKEGYEEALDHLMARFERPIFSFLLRRLQGENGIAQEITQEVFLECLQHCHRFENGRPVAAWLFTLAANTATDHLRRRVRELSVPETFDTLDPEHVSPLDQLDQSRKVDSLWGAMEGLTPRQHTIVTAYYFHERSAKNIAEDFGCAEGTVKATVFQSLAKLRKAMGNNHDCIGGSDGNV
jgi:RNA polymerase sigma-70 factor (ECF subfamily)